MSLSKPALLMLDSLVAIGGGAVPEKQIREMAGFSHGSFVAARRELVERGFIRCEPQGGNCSPVYTLLNGTMPKPCADQPKRICEPQNDRKVNKEKNLLEEIPPMPRVTGYFSDIDAWTDELMNQLGECLDIQESLVDGNEYTIFSHEFCQYDRYHVVDDDNMIEVT